MTARAFDHAVVVVDDLDLAAATFQSLGFNTSPEMRHSEELGTSNRLMLFQRTFIELLAIRTSTPVNRPFRDHLAAHGEGLLMCGLATKTEATDVATLRAAAVEAELMPLGTRSVPLPDGRTALAEFRCWYTAPPGPPGLMLFGTHHYRPEALWVPQWQDHPNGARDVRSVQLHVPDLPAHLGYVLAALGTDLQRTRSGWRALLGNDVDYSLRPLLNGGSPAVVTVHVAERVLAPRGGVVHGIQLDLMPVPVLELA